MSRPAPEIRFSTGEKEILLRWKSSETEQRMVERARVIPLAASGLSGKEIALKMKTRHASASGYGDLLKTEWPALVITFVRGKGVASTLR
jgi:hypothetical protein